MTIVWKETRLEHSTQNNSSLIENTTLQYFLFVVLLGVIFLTFFPVLRGLVLAWSSSEDNSHGFLVIPLALYVLWLKRENLKDIKPMGSSTGLFVIVISLLLYIFSLAGGIRTLASLSFVIFLNGAVLYLLGGGYLRITQFSLLLLLFMIPIPAQLIASVTIPLQLLVSKAAVAISTLIGIPLYREGNVIYHSRRAFEVVQACSGLRSISALLMLGAVFGYFFLRSNLLRAVLLLFSVPIAIGVNILRVVILIASFHYFEVDLTDGVSHSIFGLVLFAFSLLFFVLVRAGLSKWEH